MITILCMAKHSKLLTLQTTNSRFKRMCQIHKCALLLFLILLSLASRAQDSTALALWAQKLPRTDPPNRRYVADYHRDLTMRLFSGRRFYQYGLYDKGYAQQLHYRPNTPLNLGLGFNYRVLGINIGFSPGFLNDTRKYGQTGFLDLQTHLYGRKLSIDLAYLHYRGFYAQNGPFTGNDPSFIDVRPDIRFHHFGFSAQYLLNGERFSLRAAFLQNEAQLRSAGSFILGGGFSFFGVGADSSLLPKGPQVNYFDDLNIVRSTVLSGLIQAGYGYSYVFAEHFFLTLATTAGLGINYSILKEDKTHRTASWGTDVVASLRAGLGYNSRLYFAGIHYQGNRQSSSTPIPYARQQYSMGNWRLSLARRLILKKKLLGAY